MADKGAETSELSFMRARGGTAWDLAARLLLVGVCCAGLIYTAAAVTSPDLDWGLLAMAALAFAFSPLVAQVQAPESRVCVRLPLSHSILFGCSLALAPSTAAAPGAFAGIARLLVGPTQRRPLYQVLLIVLRPAAVCAFSSLAYCAAGGSLLWPHQVDSLVPLICGAFAYMAANAVTVGAAERLNGREPVVVPRAPVLLASWAAVLLAGYLLAVLYAFAPPYILLCAALCVALSRLALWEPRVGELPQGSDAAQETASAQENAGSPDTGGPVEFVDPVTGLANRRYLMMFLRRDISRVRRTNKPLSVAAFDLQQFNNLAESGQPDAAAEALAEIGRRLKAGLRDYDLVARYSPGRLVVVLPETGADGALEVAERLHRSLKSVMVNGEPVAVAAGIASFPDDGETAEDLINSSHHALNRGRAVAANGVYSSRKLAEAS